MVQPATMVRCVTNWLACRLLLLLLLLTATPCRRNSNNLQCRPASATRDGLVMCNAHNSLVPAAVTDRTTLRPRHSIAMPGPMQVLRSCSALPLLPCMPYIAVMQATAALPTF